MYYKLSNTAERETLESHFAVPFKYPNLFKPLQVINGFHEETLSIITSEEPNHISFGIWGILPQQYQEDWKYFQSITNTLHINDSKIHSDSWYKNAVRHRRCLILVTGFFTAFLREGVIYPYFVSRPSGTPFCMAGIYNYTEDGFITSSFLTVKKDKFMKQVDNISQEMPLILSGYLQRKWISPQVQGHEINQIIKYPNHINLQANPIPVDFHRNPGTLNAMRSFKLIEREYFKKATKDGFLWSLGISNGESQ
jgi:putative SOS response-associated peptidase YedK